MTIVSDALPKQGSVRFFLADLSSQEFMGGVYVERSWVFSFSGFLRKLPFTRYSSLSEHRHSFCYINPDRTRATECSV